MLLRVQFLYKGGLPIAVQRCFLRRRKNGIVHSVWLLSTKRVPIALKQTLKKELDQLSSIGVIQRVDTPTGWISALILSTKNQAFHRNHLPLAHDTWFSFPALKGLRVHSIICQKWVLAYPIIWIMQYCNHFWNTLRYLYCLQLRKNFRGELIWHL